MSNSHSGTLFLALVFIIQFGIAGCGRPGGELSELRKCQNDCPATCGDNQKCISKCLDTCEVSAEEAETGGGKLNGGDDDDDADKENRFCGDDKTDADGDGYCVNFDCDDSAPGCTADCRDADSDGLRQCDGDVDDKNRFCDTDATDADGDGYCANFDCDDSAPGCTDDCSDADSDGLRQCAGDVDDKNRFCDTDSTDADGDGYCTNYDCDDSASGCTDDCSDADNDGLPLCAGDVDDENRFCDTDATDADGDGYCANYDCDDSAPNCTDNCSDADSDGLPLCAGDIDDENRFCDTDPTDADGDGACINHDCDDAEPNCTANCSDADSDGLPLCAGDIDDENRFCDTDATDADGDGACANHDCDDSTPGCAADCSDADSDGLRQCDGDVDDQNRFCDTDGTDDDGDGFCINFDCDDWAPGCAADCSDGDSDGLRQCDGDIDDENRFCDTDPADGDGDGYCANHDCDDTAPGCTDDCTDADNDGLPLCAGDVYDDNPNCDLIATDADGDGFCINHDCADDEIYTYPGAATVDSPVDCMRDFDGDGRGDRNSPPNIVGGSDCDDADRDAPDRKTCPPPPGMNRIPAGCFAMGDSLDGDEWDTGEIPVHDVCISEFDMNTKEVTNAEYGACVNAGNCPAPSRTESYTRNWYFGNAAYDDYPVIYVDWSGADSYCKWLGRRLPTEAEWEYAARSGSSGHRFPWGDRIGCSDANYNSSSFYSYDREYLDTPCIGDTAQVGTYAANSYGLYDMVGNVSEWVNDWYGPYYQTGAEPTDDPSGPASGLYRVSRGGGWNLITILARVSHRRELNPALAENNLGFRCAAAPEGKH